MPAPNYQMRSYPSRPPLSFSVLDASTVLLLVTSILQRVLLLQKNDAH